MQEDELIFIGEAADFFAHPPVYLKIVHQVSRPLGLIPNSLPRKMRQSFGGLLQKPLQLALISAIQSIGKKHNTNDDLHMAVDASKKASYMHSSGVAITGAIAGVFGLAALPIELPISTIVMLRSIASIAQEWGMDLKDPEIKLHCLYVFGLASVPRQENEADPLSYLSSRFAFDQLIRSAAQSIGQKSTTQIFGALSGGSAPALAKILAIISKNFESTLAQRFLTKSLPAVSAIGGATINVIFSEHLGAAARYHFGLLQLEKKYGKELVQAEFKRFQLKAIQNGA